MKAELDSTFGHDIDNAPEERKQCITKGQEEGIYIFFQHILPLVKYLQCFKPSLEILAQFCFERTQRIFNL